MSEEKGPLRGASDSQPGPVPRASRMGFVWLALTLAALMAVIYGVSRQHPGKAGAGNGSGGGSFGMILPAVTTTSAQRGDINIYVNAIGTVVPLTRVSINSRVEGQILKIYYSEGQFVKAGDPLLEIDPGPNQAALTQAQGELERDQALLANARLDLQRYQDAYASNAIPKQQLDTQVATVQQYEGTVKLDQGLLDNARVQLSYCYINSPITGRVGLRLVDLGNMVQAGSTNLVVVTQLQPITVIFYVSEDNLPAIEKQLEQGQTLAVDVFDRDQQNKLASGTLETLDNEINPTTGTVNLRAIFDNRDNALFPNQFVNARLKVNTLHNVTLLPNTVIQRNADSAFVYTLSESQEAAGPQDTPASGEPAGQGQGQGQARGAGETIVQQTITVGATDGVVSEVEGIAPGTRVVADNFNKLADGMKVTVLANGGGPGQRQGRRHSAGSGP